MAHVKFSSLPRSDPPPPPSIPMFPGTPIFRSKVSFGTFAEVLPCAVLSGGGSFKSHPRLYRLTHVHKDQKKDETLEELLFGDE